MVGGNVFFVPRKSEMMQDSYFLIYHSCIAPFPHTLDTAPLVCGTITMIDQEVETLLIGLTAVAIWTHEPARVSPGRFGVVSNNFLKNMKKILTVRLDDICWTLLSADLWSFFAVLWNRGCGGQFHNLH